MAQKVTVKMLRDSKITEEELAGIFETMTKISSEVKTFDELDFSPLTIDKDAEKVAAVGFAVLGLIKKTCTSAAWKYLINDLDGFIGF